DRRRSAGCRGRSHEDATHDRRTRRRHRDRNQRRTRRPSRGRRRACRHRTGASGPSPRGDPVTFTETPERQERGKAVAALGNTYGSAYFDRAASEGRKATELWSEAGRLGYLGVAVPEEYGGGGGEIGDLAAVCEELAAAGCPLLL